MDRVFPHLKWSDFNWEKRPVFIQRSLVDNTVDSVKTPRSKALMPIDPELVTVLQRWRNASEFKDDNNFVWASPWRGGEWPLKPDAMLRDWMQPAAEQAGIPRFGWHTYNVWLGVEGTPLAVQKALMRHASITTTMNIYGGALDDAMREANSKVVKAVIQ